MNCGLMPAAAHVAGEQGAWSPADGSEFSICPGYTVALPDVIDVTHQFNHWENGALDHVCPAGVPKPLLVGLTLYKNAGEARSAFRMREAHKNRERGGHGG